MSRSARDEILGRVRATLHGNGGAGRSDSATLQAQLAARHARVRPQISADIVAQFKSKAAANLIEIRELARMAEVPAAVSDILKACNLAPDISIALELADLAWPGTMTRRSAKARIDEKLTVSLATAAIAETGTLVMCSGEKGPSSLTYAPEQHIIVLRREDITGYLEEGLAKVKSIQSPWPRAVNLVSGPSRTADVGGIVVRPAHGPKALYLLIVG